MSKRGKRANRDGEFFLSLSLLLDFAETSIDDLSCRRFPKRYRFGLCAACRSRFRKSHSISQSMSPALSF